jgi:hypothetical protein
MSKYWESEYSGDVVKELTPFAILTMLKVWNGNFQELASFGEDFRICFGGTLQRIAALKFNTGEMTDMRSLQTLAECSVKEEEQKEREWLLG